MPDEPKTVLGKEVSTDPIIRVDRSVRPPYPSHLKVLRPDLEYRGPSQYNLVELKLWLHPDQEDDTKQVPGTRIYDTLIRTHSLRKCLGLHELLMIEQKDFSLLGEIFGTGVSLLTFVFWRSVAQDNRGRGFVPVLFRINHQLKRDWLPISDTYSKFNRAVQVPSLS